MLKRRFSVLKSIVKRTGEPEREGSKSLRDRSNEKRKRSSIALGERKEIQLDLMGNAVATEFFQSVKRGLRRIPTPRAAPKEAVKDRETHNNGGGGKYSYALVSIKKKKGKGQSTSS